MDIIKEAKQLSGHCNDFINDVVKFYDTKGFITDKQKTALRLAINAENEVHETFAEHYWDLKNGR